MNILITNDDGVDSLALVPLIRAIEDFGNIRVVVPSGERSWIGKAITRHGTIAVHEVERGGFRVHAVDGTPADCVSMAIHSMGAEKPDLVVSGINLGLNYSLAFLLSSGTVGAATEAWIAGVPSIAFSMALPTDAWGVADHVRPDLIAAAAESAALVTRDILQTLLAHSYPEGVDTISVNMPANANMETPRKITGVTRSRYGRLFVAHPEGGFIHRFENLWATEKNERGDLEVVDGGAISIAPIRFELGANLPADLHAALERSR